MYNLHQDNKSFAKEHVFRKTTTQEIIERTFTTGRKPRSTININRKGSIVKERCKQLTDIALGLYPNQRITHKDLTYLVTSYIGGDRGTVRAYLGYNGYVKHTNSGFSIAIGNPRKGYLEIFGYMHKIKHNTWFIHAQSTLPQHEVKNSRPPAPNNEWLSHSKEKISLSQRGNASQVSEGSERQGACSSSKINNNNNTERERNFLQENLEKISENGIQNRIQSEVSAFLKALDKEVKP